MIDFYYYVYSKQSSPNYASVNTLQGPLCGVLGHEGFWGGISRWRPTDRVGGRGQEMEEEGDLDDWCSIANMFSTTRKLKTK